VAGGQGEFNVDRPLLVPRVPVGATCRVWEPDSGGGVSDHAVLENALTTVIAAQKNGNTSIVLANDFPEPLPPPPPPPATPQNDAELIITKHVDRSSAAVGQDLIYTIEVANAGPATATDVRVSDISSQALRLLGVSVTQGGCSAALPVVCALGSLAPGARAAVTLEASGTAAGALRNTATASANQANPAPAGAAAVAVTQLNPERSRLRIAKTPSLRRVGGRATVSYQIRVQALGSVAAIGVRVCDRLSPYLAVISFPHAHLFDGRPCWTIPVLDPGHPRAFTVRVLTHNVPTALLARDAASASAQNAATVHARAAIEITPRPTSTPVTG
jgi:uncharacterized repeat protein (TIGR01451 family)